MSERKSLNAASSERFLEGKLLIAMPGMPDPRFEKSIIFMCAHSSKGAMGLIVNKPIEGFDFHALMQQLEIPAGVESPAAPILFGGPVDMGQGFVLHSSDYGSATSTLRVTPDISLTTTAEILSAIADGRGPKKALLALGYSGWEDGQIEDEILANGWLHCDADPDLIFGTDYDSKWQIAIGKLGAGVAGLSADAGRA